jgi:diguanylate cyclase (GGDEF)-like protein
MSRHARTAGPSRRPIVTACLLALVFSVALAPVVTRQLGPTVSFVPAMLGVVTCFDVMSVYLLVGEYRDSGDIRLLAMSWAYLASLVFMGAYAFAFPGVTVHPPLAITPSMAPWFYVAWHAGFPTLLGIAWAPWPARWTANTRPSRRRGTVAASFAAIAALSGAVVALLALNAKHLPVLIKGLDTYRMTVITAPFAVPLVALSLLAAYRGTRRRTGPESWSVLAVLVCLCDLGLTYTAHYRYSLGWYAGRSLTLVASGAVLVAMMASFRRLKARAEHDATVDMLTGLANRRSGYGALAQMLARSQRSLAPLSVIALDIDFFKQVNDRFGHETGDAVLENTGRLLTRCLRLGDVAARVGGEEFLVLLPDTDMAGSMIVAERIRVAVCGSRPSPGLPTQITVSLGVACSADGTEPAEALLRRADEALYEAKHRGRNVAVAAPTTLVLAAIP